MNDLLAQTEAWRMSELSPLNDGTDTLHPCKLKKKEALEGEKKRKKKKKEKEEKKKEEKENYEKKEKKERSCEKKKKEEEDGCEKKRKEEEEGCEKRGKEEESCGRKVVILNEKEVKHLWFSAVRSHNLKMVSELLAQDIDMLAFKDQVRKC